MAQLGMAHQGAVTHCGPAPSPRTLIPTPPTPVPRPTLQPREATGKPASSHPTSSFPSHGLPNTPRASPCGFSGSAHCSAGFLPFFLPESPDPELPWSLAGGRAPTLRGPGHWQQGLAPHLAWLSRGSLNADDQCLHDVRRLGGNWGDFGMSAGKTQSTTP